MNEFKSLIFVEKKQRKSPIFWTVLFMLVTLGLVGTYLEVMDRKLAIIFFLLPTTLYYGYRFNLLHFGQNEKLEGYFDGELKMDSEKIIISQDEYLIKNIKSVKLYCNNIHGTDLYSQWTGHSRSNGETNLITLTLKDQRIIKNRFKLLTKNHARQLNDWISFNKDKLEIDAKWIIDIL